MKKNNFVLAERKEVKKKKTRKFFLQPCLGIRQHHVALNQNIVFAYANATSNK
jgi:hypothetical protein